MSKKGMYTSSSVQFQIPTEKLECKIENGKIWIDDKEANEEQLAALRKKYPDLDERIKQTTSAMGDVFGPGGTMEQVFGPGGVMEKTFGERKEALKIDPKDMDKPMSPPKMPPLQGGNCIKCNMWKHFPDQLQVCQGCRNADAPLTEALKDLKKTADAVEKEHGPNLKMKVPEASFDPLKGVRRFDTNWRSAFALLVYLYAVSTVVRYAFGIGMWFPILCVVGYFQFFFVWKLCQWLRIPTQFLFDRRDMWLGIFVDDDDDATDIFICVCPMFPWHIRMTHRGIYD